MTKTLTEQLKKGTLKDGLYYIKDNDNILIGLRHCLTMTRLIDDGCPSFEVIAPVPSYDECNELAQKIHILNEANMKLENELGQFAEASKTIERLQEQLKYANKIIDDLLPF